MKELLVSDLRPGMVVAKDVQNAINYRMILQSGTELTDTLIARLQLHGVITVMIDDGGKASDEDINNLSYSERLRLEPEFIEFKKAYEENLTAFRGMLTEAVEKHSKLDTDALLDSTMRIADMGRPHTSVLDMMMLMRDYDDSTFAHCLSVALLSNLLATWLHMDKEQVELATLCGLLHDVGKMKIPIEIINKPSSLTTAEYIAVKKHTIAGYEILKEMGCNNHVCNAALMHHERIDGTGYPLRLRDMQIDQYARIVAIADVYDAMTSARVYRGPLCPFRVIEVFEQDGYDKYDVEYLLAFLDSVVDTYIQNRCRLSDGSEGEIVYINKEKLSRPIVQVENGYKNLAELPELFVDALI